MQKRAEALLIVIGRHEWWWLENPCGITNPPEHQLLFWFPQRRASRNAEIAKAKVAR
jgi:hypothetical protein